jgi:molecular chaperone HtpG
MSDDWREEIKLRLKECDIYRKLEEKCQIDPSGSSVLSLVEEGVYYCYHKAKTVLAFMNEYTLHDSEHLFHVLQIMGRLIPPQILDMLSVPELMLLTLSSFFHDIGMAPEIRDIESWKKFWDRNPEFIDERDKIEYAKFSKFASSHPNKTEEINEKLINGFNQEADRYKTYLISDYIRSTHSGRAKEILKQDWNEKIRYRDVDLTVEFAELCSSHCEDAMILLQMDFCYICGPDIFICFPLLGVLLRLSDILDFDSKRAPTILFSHLYVKHPISIAEWNKHRAVESWVITPEIIAFHAKCTHPAIEASINDFCDSIDNELILCNNILAEIPSSTRSFRKSINFKLPLKINRDRIETKRDIEGKPIYHFTRTQFNLSKKQVIDLLMGTKLYGNPEIALRELIQNSIDACLLRRALEKKWGNPYDPRITVKYYSSSGEDFLEVNDNGTGMDQYIIDNYYSRVGSSFYTSSDYFDLRTEFKPDFIPTSRFGIGILSCFMVSDTIITDTRRVKGPNNSSEPLNITIEGQDSIFWVKEGKRENVGTDTCLVLRKKKHPWDKMSHQQFITSVKNRNLYI